MEVENSSEYRGKFDHKMDPKNRVAVPVEFRPGEGEKLYLLESHREGRAVIKALTTTRVRSMENSVRDRADLTPAHKDLIIGKLNADCVAVQINPQGKLLVPKKICEYAQLKGDVKLVGRGDYFEIWNPKGFAEAEQLELAKLAEINAELGFF